MRNEMTELMKRIAVAAATVGAGALVVGGAASAAKKMIHRGESSGITYVHGGVGKKAMGKIESLADDFDLMAVFTNEEGAYLADVDVELESVEGNREVDLKTAGPVFLANLPAGEYRLTANVPDREKARHVFTSREGDRTELTLQLED